jgi:hypothetical protein
MSKGREGRGADVDTSLTTCPDSAAHTERERERGREGDKKEGCVGNAAFRISFLSTCYLRPSRHSHSFCDIQCISVIQIVWCHM